MHKIRKDQKHPHYGSKYANIEGILDQVKPLCQECGLVLLQPIQNNSVVSYLIDPDTGHSFPPFNKKDVGLTLQQADPQKKGGEVTYFRRYSVVSLLSLEQEDDDSNQTRNQPTHAPINRNDPWS